MEDTQNSHSTAKQRALPLGENKFAFHHDFSHFPHFSVILQFFLELLAEIFSSKL